MSELRTYVNKITQSVTLKTDKVDSSRVRIKCVPSSSSTSASVVLSNSEAQTLINDLKNLIAPPPPPPTPMPPKIYWGARMDGDVYGGGDAPWDQNTWNTFESHAKKKVSLVSFGQPAPWTQAFSPSPLDLCFARNAVPMLDMQIGTNTLADIVAGKRDVEITTWAKAVKVYGKPFLYRWCHEMNGTWYGYGKEAAVNPDLYVRAWQHWKDICDANGAKNITWVWCPNVIFPGSTPLASLYPGDNYVDWIGIDGYNFGGTDWKTPGKVFDATYNALAFINSTKPIVICETGCSESGGSKASWIADLYIHIIASYPRIRAVSWFNWNILEGSGRRDWPIESSPGAQAAFSLSVADPTYVAGGYVPVMGTKVVPA